MDGDKRSESDMHDFIYSTVSEYLTWVRLNYVVHILFVCLQGWVSGVFKVKLLKETQSSPSAFPPDLREGENKAGGWSNLSK